MAAAAELAARHINDRQLPDKAIDVIDEAGARLRLKPKASAKRWSTTQMVEDVVARIARIPPKNVSTNDKDTLRNLERNLKLVIYGQDPAIESLAAAIKMSRSGLGDQRVPSAHSCSPVRPASARPRSRSSSRSSASGLFAGHVEVHGAAPVSRLIDAPPGYVGFDQGIHDRGDQQASLFGAAR